MNSADLDLIADCLEKSRRALMRYRGLIQKILGSSPEEVKETLSLMHDLTPSQIREACRLYKNRGCEA